MLEHVVNTSSPVPCRQLHFRLIKKYSLLPIRYQKKLLTNIEYQTNKMYVGESDLNKFLQTFKAHCDPSCIMN